MDDIQKIKIAEKKLAEFILTCAILSDKLPEEVNSALQRYCDAIQDIDGSTLTFHLNNK